MMRRRTAICAVVGMLAACNGGADRERGRALFAGEAPLVARIAGHAETLPSIASRCANCHAFDRTSAAASAVSFGPALSPRFLREARSRRGGPASRFDAASLCQLLRTGVDPAYILIPRSMPMYEISDRDCRALWEYMNND